jgi:hypothetical protein
VKLAVRPGVHRVVERCPAGRRLLGATHAVGLYTSAAPTPAQMESVDVAQAVHADRVELVVRAQALSARAVVQVDLDCAGAP